MVNLDRQVPLGFGEALEKSTRIKLLGLTPPKNIQTKIKHLCNMILVFGTIALALRGDLSPLLP